MQSTCAGLSLDVSVLVSVAGGKTRQSSHAAGQSRSEYGGAECR